MNFRNRPRRRPRVGVLGAQGIGVGEPSVPRTVSTYYDNDEILQIILNNTEPSLDLITQGADGRSMIFDLPRIKFSGGAPDVPGKNADVTIPGTYQAIRDAALGYTMSAQRVNFAR